jgi:3-oxoacyl-[acyl-carrier protein] reductase
MDKKPKESEQKVALITGASRGIGSHLAVSFAFAGYTVAINYLSNKEKAEETLSKIHDFKGDAFLVKADVSNAVSVKAMISEIEKEKKRIDVVINNAGITRDHTIMKMSYEEWDEVIKTNLYGTFNVVKEVSRVMAKNKGGAIINLESISAFQGSFGAANYSASKGGIVSLTKAAARELGRFSIRVNAVLPGFHLTDLGQKAPEHIREKMKSDNVLNASTDIQELCEFVLLLARMKTVSGQIFNWDARII